MLQIPEVLASSHNQEVLVLASSSPRRKALLAQAGYQFQMIAANIPEERQVGEDAAGFATRLAREKAQFVFDRLAGNRFAGDREARGTLAGETLDAPRLVLGADTVVVAGEEVLGKPKDAADAARMLRLLSGRVHRVITGLCLLSRDSIEVAAEETAVEVGTISAAEIAAYIATGEPMDKAGAYAIQGHAARWIPRIEGCYFNVVGLPIARVTSMIEAETRRRYGATASQATGLQALE